MGWAVCRTQEFPKGSGDDPPFPFCPISDARALKSGHLLAEATTSNTAPISALLLAAHRAEVYRRP
jgi:hypothetical protein